MKRNKFAPIALVGAAALLLAGCSTNSAGAVSGESAVGTWAASAEETPNITFAEDGTFTGHDGCVGFDGQWSVDGDSVKVDLLKAPLRGCIGVDQWLIKADSFVISDDEITAVSKAGDSLGTLPKSS